MQGLELPKSYCEARERDLILLRFIYQQEILTIIPHYCAL